MPLHGKPYAVSLHGGHAGAYCDHAEGRLRDILEAAAGAGFHTYGVSEHAPRVEERFLYPEEVEMGWDVDRVRRNFEDYCRDIDALAEEFAERLTVLRGFEAEVVPADRYAEVMLGFRDRFDYMVGSVHYVDEITIDGQQRFFDEALERCGGLEPLAIRYYETVVTMVETLRPDVVGHLDVVRKLAPRGEPVDTPPIRRAARQALEAVRDRDGILDLNTAGWRKGLDSPYPAPWLVREARAMGVPFCFGDDSHGPEQVGAGMEEGRRYLLDHGVEFITYLTRRGGEMVREQAPLI